MKNLFQKTRIFVSTHKKTSAAIAVVVIISGYYGFRSLTSKAASPTYTLGTVTKGTVVSSITGSGQVSSNRSLDLKPQASGNVVYVGVTAGEEVPAGDLIVELDASDAQKSVRDAEANLVSANISLQKTEKPADSLTLLQAQNSLTQAKSDLAQTYDDGFNNVSSAFLNLPTMVSGLDAILHNSDVSASANGQQNLSYYADTSATYETAANSGKAAAYKSDAETKYQLAKAAYDKTFSDYKNTSRTANTSDIGNLINETYATSQLIADSIQSTQTLIQYYQTTITTQYRQPVPKSNTHLQTLLGDTNQINGSLSQLLGNKNSITSGTTNVPEKQVSLDKIQSGADPLDLQSAELGVTKAQNSLQDAKDNLENYFVRAPFSGTVAKIDVARGDPAGSGTAVATLIAADQVVDIPLNEVDVSKVKVGDKATFTFDAIDGLTLTGKVVSIDAVGTVSQGVVNYTVTIGFDSTDPRVKPGMSTTASIITQVESDVLTVPSSAVKNSANGSYVQIFPAAVSGTTDGGSQSIVSETPPEQIPVTVGISDDTSTEIVSGLTEGQIIVTKTITAAATKTATASAPSLLGGATAGRAGGGAAFRTTAIGR